MTSAPDTLILDSFSRLCQAELGKDFQQRMEQGEFDAPLWRRIESLGLPGLLSDYGDALEAPQQTARAVAELSGYCALPLPLVETLIAREVLARAGIEAPEGVLAIGVVEGTLSSEGEAAAPSVSGHAVVGWARHAEHLVVVVPAESGDVAALIDRQATGLGIEASGNLAGEPRDRVELVAVPCLHHAPLPGGIELVQLQAARLRAALMVGATEAALDLSVAYVRDRVQFGKPLGKFQAVQQSLATAYGELASARSACALAFANRRPDWRTVAVAKMRADVAASLACNVAHQAHGAIGVTSEYPLHRHTRRLWSWRSENGSGASWARRLGRAFIAQGPDRLWPAITDMRLPPTGADAPTSPPN